MIKCLSKIIVICYSVIYFLAALQPFHAEDNWKASFFFSAMKQSFIALERNGEHNSGITSFTNLDINLLNSTPVARLGFKPNMRSFDFLLQKYILCNDLDFNSPLICFKFPLSEHSEAG